VTTKPIVIMPVPGALVYTAEQGWQLIEVDPSWEAGLRAEDDIPPTDPAAWVDDGPCRCPECHGYASAVAR
jgi:hypothetical protein